MTLRRKHRRRLFDLCRPRARSRGAPPVGRFGLIVGGLPGHGRRLRQADRSVSYSPFVLLGVFARKVIGTRVDLRDIAGPRPSLQSTWNCAATFDSITKSAREPFEAVCSRAVDLVQKAKRPVVSLEAGYYLMLACLLLPRQPMSRSQVVLARGVERRYGVTGPFKRIT